jgi:hypothetical protein
MAIADISADRLNALAKEIGAIALPADGADADAVRDVVPPRREPGLPGPVRVDCRPHRRAAGNRRVYRGEGGHHRHHPMAGPRLRPEGRPGQRRLPRLGADPAR